MVLASISGYKEVKIYCDCCFRRTSGQRRFKCSCSLDICLDCFDVLESHKDHTIFLISKNFSENSQEISKEWTPFEINLLFELFLIKGFNFLEISKFFNKDKSEILSLFDSIFHLKRVFIEQHAKVAVPDASYPFEENFLIYAPNRKEIEWDLSLSLINKKNMKLFDENIITQFYSPINSVLKIPDVFKPETKDMLAEVYFSSFVDEKNLQNYILENNLQKINEIKEKEEKIYEKFKKYSKDFIQKANQSFFKNIEKNAENFLLEKNFLHTIIKIERNYTDSLAEKIRTLKGLLFILEREKYNCFMEEIVKEYFLNFSFELNNTYMEYSKSKNIVNFKISAQEKNIAKKLNIKKSLYRKIKYLALASKSEYGKFPYKNFKKIFNIASLEHKHCVKLLYKYFKNNF